MSNHTIDTQISVQYNRTQPINLLTQLINLRFKFPAITSTQKRKVAHKSSSFQPRNHK